jgi:cutinase
MITVAAVALVGGAVAVAPHLKAHGSTERVRQAGAVTTNNGTYNGTVSINGSDTAMYEYPGGPAALDTSLTTIGRLNDGAQVQIKCYLTGTSVTGPNGLGAGGADDYWDSVGLFSGGAFVPGFTPPIPAGDAAVVPDAYIHTSTPVNQLVPACAAGSAGSVGGNAGLAGSAGGSAGSAALGAGPSAPPTAGDACPDVDVVFARGTGEQQNDRNGLSSVGQPFFDALTKDLPGKTVKAYGVQFQADFAQTSTAAGADDMENHVETLASQCPSTKFVLGGYSQGAAVVDVAIGLGPVLSPVYAQAGLALAAILGPGAAAGGSALAILVASHPGLPDSLAGRIAAVVTWGNPIHWANQSIATASPVYGPKSADFCDAQDPVCANGTDFSLTTHRQYVALGLAAKGAQFAANDVSTAG